MFIMLVGLPGSGKSTYAAELLKRNTEYQLFSSDAIREEDNTLDNAAVFQTLHRRIKEALFFEKTAIYDATNISEKRRAAFLSEIASFDCLKECHILATPLNICIERNATRPKPVPEHVIRKMYTQFYVPQFQEMWDDIQIVPTEPTFDEKLHVDAIDEVLYYAGLFDQRNRHHSRTLGNHLIHTWAKAAQHGDRNLGMAALLHDIGKLNTQTFTTSTGEPTEDAHYYGHEHASAYDALWMLAQRPTVPIGDVLEVCKYIQWHMWPYQNLSEKTILRKKSLWGDKFYNNLLLLHKADKAAH